MKRILTGLTAVLLAAVLPVFARAEELCWEQDFDGDGMAERFLIEGEEARGYVAGDLIYEDDGARQTIWEDGGWLPGECAAWQMPDGTWLFKVEESYGIIGSASHVYRWTEDGIAETNGVFSALEWIGDADFTFEFIDTDRNEDRTGRTAKKYYQHWMQDNFVEYGALRIDRGDVAALPGGEAVLEAIKASGNSIKSVYYRENGIVNITYCDGMVNGNATLLLKDGALTLLATDGSPAQELSESDYGGMYQQISGCTRYVTYPASFPGADS